MSVLLKESSLRVIAVVAFAHQIPRQSRVAGIVQEGTDTEIFMQRRIDTAFNRYDESQNCGIESMVRERAVEVLESVVGALEQDVVPSIHHLSQYLRHDGFGRLRCRRHSSFQVGKDSIHRIARLGVEQFHFRRWTRC